MIWTSIATKFGILGYFIFAASLRTRPKGETATRRAGVGGRIKNSHLGSFSYLIRARFLKKTLALALAWCYVGTRAP